MRQHRENIEDLFSKISSVSVDFALCGLLNLKGQTRGHFLEFVSKEFPNLYEKYLKLYKGAFVAKEYRDDFYEIVNESKRKFGIKNNYPKFEEGKQLELW